MAKLTLTFDLDETDDLNDVLWSLYGVCYANVITQLDEWLQARETGGRLLLTPAEVRQRLHEETEGLPGLWLD